MENISKPVFRKPGREDFFLKMRREVQETVLKNQQLKNRSLAKAILLLSLYFGCYAGILLLGNNTALLFFFYTAIGLTMIVLFVNSFHDAVHGSLFKKPRYNRWFTQILALFGSNTWLWTKRHLALHHVYPNVQHWDIDIKQGRVVRIFPNSPLGWFHKYQHIYMWFFYPLYSLNWIFIRDFRDFFSKRDNYIRHIAEIPKIEIYKLFAAKIGSLFFIVGIPMMVLQQPWYMIVAAWLFMHIMGSMLGVVALVSTHVDEHAEFPDPEGGDMGMTWAEHQMRTTKDFSTESSVANFLFGGFTHHVAHHLFPGLAHTYYPRITPIIRRYAQEYGLPYTNYPFYEAMRSHFRMLRKSGRENLFESGEL